LVCNNKSVCEAKELGLKENIPITIGDKTYKPKYKKCISENDAMQLQFFDMNFISGVTIVPDSADISKLYKCTNYMSASYNKDYKFEGNYNSIDDYVVDKVVEENEEGSGFKIYPSKKIKNSITYATAFAIFIVIYIGIVFMITSAAILALKTLTDANDNIGKYVILRQIGVSEKMINKSLFYQNILFFGMPIALSIVHSIFGIKLVRDFFTMLGLDCPIKSIFISFGIILIIYGLYFILTNKTCKRIIRERR
ncbi:MAG: hypothetical protein K6E24_03585, partial [bacterium]|nr:hypothetical protein [bacterium]